MAVMLMGSDRVLAETAICRNIDRQCVVMAEQKGFAITSHQQFGRQSAVKCPHGIGILGSHFTTERSRRAQGERDFGMLNCGF